MKTRPHVKGFSARYEEIPLPTSGPWFDAAIQAHRILAGNGIAILFGCRGTGKTFMAWDLANSGKFRDPLDSDGNPRPVICMTAMKCFLRIRDTWRKDSEMSELELFEFLEEVALLVIDEIQERGETPFENQKLTALIDARYQAMRPTLLIGNYDSAEDMAESLGSSIVSRIQECGGAIQCDWPSFRGKSRE